jgi:hypothetical protein
MPTFYIAELNPAASALDAAGTFSGRVTVQPTTNSTTNSGDATMALGTIGSYFEFYTAANEQSVSFGTDNLVTWASHGLSENQEIVFSSISATNGITVGTSYYVIASGLVAGAFKISTSVGGSALDITAATTGTVRDVLVTGVSGLARGTNYVAATDNSFTLSSHGLSNGATIIFSSLGDAEGTDAASNAFAINTIYYVINKATNTFDISHESGGTAVDITTAGTCIGGTTDAAGTNGFVFTNSTNASTLQDEFTALLATEVFGSSEASDLFSNVSAINTSHTTACTAATTTLKGLVRTSGASASEELVNAMFADKATTQRFTLPYKSTQLANTIVTGTDLAVTGSASGAGAYVDLTAKAVTFTLASTPNVTIASHGLTVGDVIQFAQVAGATNFTEATNYYVKTVESGDDTITLSATSGGVAVAVNADGTGNMITSLRLSTNAVSFTASNDTVTIASGHPFSDTNPIYFTDINTTTGISVDTKYFVRDKTATTFKVESSVGGGALTLTNDGNGIITRTATTDFAKGETATITGVDGSSNAATITIALNDVQKSVLNGKLNNVAAPSDVPLETGDVIRVLYTIASKTDQEDTSGDGVTATQTFFVDFTVG